MGEVYAKYILNIDQPKIGLLSIGEEDVKGNELTREAFKLIKDSHVNFIGNIEGQDIYAGEADVVVCDGFVGNITLKVSEGLAKTITRMLKKEIIDSASAKLGGLFFKSAFKNFKRKTDYSEYGGAPLLGISKPCIMSHGRSSAKAIKNAIKVANVFHQKKILDIISTEFGSGISRGAEVDAKK
jgi:glycerol-3-phosphate acyltransferase PlsX